MPGRCDASGASATEAVTVVEATPDHEERVEATKAVTEVEATPDHEERVEATVVSNDQM